MLVATLGGDGLRRFAESGAPEVNGVAYLVSCQHPDTATPPEIPAEIGRRSDIRVIFTPTKGLSVNRNNLFDHADAPLFLIADDDLTYDRHALEMVVTAFDTMPEADILTFRYAGPSLKRYPPDGHSLDRPWKNYYVSSIEIGGRLDAIRRAGLKFSPLAGIGAPVLTAGEEAFFIRAALRRGLRVLHCAVSVAAHPAQPTGLRKPSPGFLKSRGAVIAVTRPLTAPLRIPWRAWADRRSVPPFRHFRYMTAGALYALFHLRHL